MPGAPFLSLFGRGYLDAVQLRGLSQLADKVDFRAGQTIFSEGDRANTVFGLSKGLVRIYKSLPDGRRQVLAFALPGYLLGMPLRERTMRLLNDFATRKLEMAQELLLLVCHASAEERVRTFLANWRNRLASLSTPLPILPLPMRRQDIADFLGLTLETVSRTFAKLQDQKIIRVVPKGVVLREDRNPRPK